MSQAKKLICPRCGTEMNHHATKVDYSASDDSAIDAIFGGVLEEVHTCPNCGRIQVLEAGGTMTSRTRLNR